MSFGQFLSPLELVQLEADGLPQVHRRAQVEDRFGVPLADVNVNRLMVVAVEKEAESVFREDRRHVSFVPRGSSSFNPAPTAARPLRRLVAQCLFALTRPACERCL